MDKIFKNLGSRGIDEREHNDFYATDPAAVKELLQFESFSPVIWEPAVGMGHIAKVLEEEGYNVIGTDLIYRGYGEKEPKDFLNSDVKDFEGDIITNPPYKYALEFVKKSLDTVKEGQKVVMLLRLLFLEGVKRKQLFTEHPPKYVYVFSYRIKGFKNGDFSINASSAMAFAWFVWEKGYKGETVVRWI